MDHICFQFEGVDETDNISFDIDAAHLNSVQGDHEATPENVFPIYFKPLNSSELMKNDIMSDSVSVSNFIRKNLRCQT